MWLNGRLPTNRGVGKVTLACCVKRDGREGGGEVHT